MIHILIADDEKPARFGMAKALANAGYEISEANDGQAALEAIQTKLPDLVFLDLNMPKLEGRDVLRRLGPATRDCEIVRGRPTARHRAASRPSVGTSTPGR